MKKRIRLTEEGSTLNNRVRSGSGTLSEERDVVFSENLLADPPNFDKMDRVHPGREGALNRLVERGLLEVYESIFEDYLDSLNPKEEKSLPIYQEDLTMALKGERLILFVARASIVGFYIPPLTIQIVRSLERFKLDDDLPLEIVRGLVKEGYLYSGEEDD